MTLEQTLAPYVQFSDPILMLALVWLWGAVAYAAIGKMAGVRAFADMRRSEGRGREFVREHVNFVLIGALIGIAANILYYLLLTLNVQWVETELSARYLIFRVPFGVWLLLLGIHLFNGRINAVLRFLSTQKWMQTISRWQLR